VLELLADDRPAVLLALQQRADLPRALPLLLGLLADDEDFQAGEPIELELQDCVGLLGVEPKSLDDLLRRVRLAFGLPHDLQDLVQRVEDLLEALEDVDALLE